MVKKHSWFLTINNPLDHEIKLCSLAIMNDVANSMRKDLADNYYGQQADLPTSNKDLNPKNLAYFGFAEEVGKQGTKHLHCLIVFKAPKSFANMKKIFPRANIQAMRGSLDEAITYVRKDGRYHSAKFIPIERIKTYVDNDNKLSRLSAQGDKQIQEYQNEVKELRQELREFKLLIAKLLAEKKILNKL